MAAGVFTTGHFELKYFEINESTFLDIPEHHSHRPYQSFKWAQICTFRKSPFLLVNQSWVSCGYIGVPSIMAMACGIRPTLEPSHTPAIRRECNSDLGRFECL